MTSAESTLDAEIARVLRTDEMPIRPISEIEEEARVEQLVHLVDTNFQTIDRAFADFQKQLNEVKRRPPRERRTGAAARVNPDNINLFYAVLVGSLLLPAFTFAASFNFQREFGVYTPLEESWWWVIPCILELPLIVLTPMILIFQRRHESVVGPWVAMIALTVAASAINFLHAETEQGLTTATDWAGAVFIASWPILTLVTFKFFARLAVKPEPKPAEPAKPTQKKAARR
jgi:hypothetical protein